MLFDKHKVTSRCVLSHHIIENLLQMFTFVQLIKRDFPLNSPALDERFHVRQMQQREVAVLRCIAV